ncbi:biotin-dependent carboxyltransferase family protein [Ferviditalea candida]|uniref:Biotin-dependent carboxyltransferase family protein n=1 Tax=Ferviditalea candida TaxID=3108399 RepID=A0ABU5ZF05_9BACL|nr:biotin-dependent carboxyltransferase family protein [Paenibacillaceae bacterium T2]
MSLIIHHPGLLTTVQDAGRQGFLQYGVTESGAMDTYALRIANLLAGNSERAAALELTLNGGSFEFAEDMLIAVCGADMSAAIGSVAVPMWKPVFVRKGSVMSFGRAVSGCRTYLAAAGGLDVTEVMGSAGTYLRGGFGGYGGRALQKGDHLRTGAKSDWSLRQIAQLSGRCGEREFAAAAWSAGSIQVVSYLYQPFVRAMRGHEFDLFKAESRELFFDGIFRVESPSDRMGYLLSGERLSLTAPQEAISEAVAFGTVQVPPSGSPIVLMADHPTTGGYPRIAQAAFVDLPVLAQTKPGESVRFREITLAEAQRLYAVKEMEIRQLREAISLK